MSIVIRELVIKTSLSEGGGEQASGSGGEGGKEEIVAECVEQVLSILKDKAER
ncbi:DUF5908 family protein [Synechococcus sp. PCC 7336]|uniref:DUF5908 family protein n=1 Tax=Synechococcus sp. PCC 7336 TaxID=195250 RepID=UPI00034BF9BA|nr:DUF5908 family protein [Synechococcus sp. PCC 7336]